MTTRLTDEQIAVMLQKLPASTQFAIVNCMPNLPYGASWGLCRMEEVKVGDRLKEIKSDKNLFAMPVNDGVILQVVKGYLESICNSVCKGLISTQDLETMNKMQKTAFTVFDNFLAKKVGKNKSFSELIGIYCTNMVPNIRYKDVDYPAFRVDLTTALQLLHKYGVDVQVGEMYVSALEASAIIQKDPIRISKSLVMSPTMTGVFIKIAKR